MGNIEKLKKISIRGRVAFSIKCLENVLNEKRIQVKSILKNVIDFLKKYTSCEKLYDWEAIANEYAPITILDEHVDNKYDEYEFLKEPEICELKTEYENLPTYIVSMIDLIIEVGAANVYGGIDDYSPLILEPTLNIIKIMEDNKFNIPYLDTFEKYQFAENKGWGTPFLYGS